MHLLLFSSDILRGQLTRLWHLDDWHNYKYKYKLLWNDSDDWEVSDGDDYTTTQTPEVSHVETLLNMVNSGFWSWSKGGRKASKNQDDADQDCDLQNHDGQGQDVDIAGPDHFFFK